MTEENKAASPPAREEAPADGAGERDRIKRAIADGFSNGYETYDEASEMQRLSYDMAADAVLALRNRTSEPEAGENSQNDYSPRKTLTGPAPATADKLRELIEAAYIAGATNVHEYWCDNPGEAPAPRDDPEFDEAASDYAFAALNEQPR